MKQVSVREAKTHLSRLLREAESGEEIIIFRAGKPAARLVSVGNDAPGIIGLLKGKFVVPDDFDDPLPDDLCDLFEDQVKRNGSLRAWPPLALNGRRVPLIYELPPRCAI